MPKPTIDPFTVTRAQALDALDEPENHPGLAKALHGQIQAFGARLQGVRRLRLRVKNDFEQVAAEALVKAVAEAEYEDDHKPPVIGIVRTEGWL